GFKGKVYPGLALEALGVAMTDEQGNTPPLLVKMAGGGGKAAFGFPDRIVSIRVGPIEIPSTEDGQMWGHYTTDVPSRRIPAWKIMDGSADMAQLQGAAIFIGTSAAGLLDLRSTPMRIDAPGVEVHIQALEQMLTKDFLARPDWANGLELAFALLL